MTKVAVLSDVHGNVTALAATIADAKAQGADEFWFLGDLFMPGPGAHDVVEMLRELNVTVWLRGNWDDFMFAALERTVDYTSQHVFTRRVYQPMSCNTCQK
ncbi:metallophosphoesterase family protein [Weissella confusa]|uniref:metallophosphoesterase family protein n=1 Tax=Weissella confusa TaxID=1583 RepID=UPI00223BB708|nr:metallophosphoesterase family protein [Weissella confusa]